MGIIRQMCTFFLDTYEGALGFKPNERLEIYETIFDYMFYDKEPDKSCVKPSTYQAFRGVKQALDNAKTKYDNQVKQGEYGKLGAEYGKLGGRPRKTTQPEGAKTPLKTPKNPLGGYDKTPENPQEEEYKLELVINNIFNNNLECACAREKAKEHSDKARAPYIEYFSEFFDIPRPEEYKAPGFEIVDTMIEALEYAYCTGMLRFKQTAYTALDLTHIFARITQHQFLMIATQLLYNDDIQNRAYYILGCLVTASKTKGVERRSADEMDNFIKQIQQKMVKGRVSS